MSAAIFPATPAQEARFWQLRRALQARYIRRKPTIRERAALDAAALILTRQEFTAKDASTSPDQIAKLTAASHRAQRALIEVAAERRKPDGAAKERERVPTLSELLAQDRARAGGSA
jgi:hypothetical protein